MSNRYYSTRIGLAALLIAYPVLAISGPHQARAEFYPFFKWNLFSRSMTSWEDAVIDGEALPEPAFFYDLGQHFAAARNKDIRLAKMLDNLIRAENAGNRAMSAHVSDVIEQTFMADAASVKYDIAIIRYDSLQRYRSGEIADTTVITSGEKTP